MALTELLLNSEVWAAFVTLTALEVILGIDNIIFISIVSGRLPPAQQGNARRIGLILALGLRIALLVAVAWLAALTAPIASLGGFVLTWRDIVLFSGGAFLIYKGTLEIHKMMEGDAGGAAPAHVTFAAAIAQIAVIDVVFSLDSVITAIGMTDSLPVIIAAILISVLVMALAAAPVSDFVNRHRTVKMLALGFLLLVGMTLIAESAHFHIPRGYLYFAIGFSLAVETLNLIVGRSIRKRGEASR